MRTEYGLLLIQQDESAGLDMYEPDEAGVDKLLLKVKELLTITKQSKNATIQ